MANTGVAEVTANEHMPSTQTEERLEAVVKNFATALGSEDGSIIVIENPIRYTRGLGQLGLLLSRHYTERNNVPQFSDVLHARIGNYGLTYASPIKKATIKIGVSQGPYFYVESDTGTFIPQASRMPYEICFISPEDYERFKSGLEEKQKGIETAIYELLGKNVDSFSFNGKELLLPSEYANATFDKATAIPRAP